MSSDDCDVMWRNPDCDVTRLCNQPADTRNFTNQCNSSRLHNWPARVYLCTHVIAILYSQEEGGTIF